MNDSNKELVAKVLREIYNLSVRTDDILAIEAVPDYDAYYIEFSYCKGIRSQRINGIDIFNCAS